MDRYTLYETYRLAILIDLVQTDELIGKVDAFIAKTPIEKIPHVFYILSLTSSRRLMIGMLTDLARGIDQSLPSYIVAGMLGQRQEQYTTAELYMKAGMLASLLEDPDEDVAYELRLLKERYDALQEAYGARFKRKKARERMLAKNELDLKRALAKYIKYAEQFNRFNWEHFIL